MPNHVHLILVPSDPDGLRRALARVHRSSYAGTIQSRRKRTGHFWQGRFGAVAMDEQHFATAYATCRSTRCERAWCGGHRIGAEQARAHSRGKGDGVTALAPIRDRFPQFADLLATEPETDLFMHCVQPRASAGRSETAAFSPVSSARPGASSSRPSAGPSRPCRKTDEI